MYGKNDNISRIAANVGTHLGGWSTMFNVEIKHPMGRITVSIWLLMDQLSGIK